MASFEELIKKADAGDADAQVDLGLAYEKGEAPGGVNHELCYKYYKMAADQGDSMGLNNLGVCYEHGYGVKQDYSEATRLFELSAEKGNAYGAANAAHMYMAELGVKFDESKVLKYTQQGAEGGMPICQYNLGYWYLSGEFHLERDVEKAQKWIEAAAKAGHQMAQDILKHTQGDLSKFEKAESNHEEMQKAREMFNSGDYNTALAITHAEVDKGYPNAMAMFYEMMEVLLQNSKCDFIKDEETGEQHLMILTPNGGNMIYNKVKLPANCVDKWISSPDDFTPYLEKAAELGDIYSMNTLGRLYAMGVTKQKDLHKAIEYFEQAARRGDQTAAANLKQAQAELNGEPMNTFVASKDVSRPGCMTTFLIIISSIIVAACSLL